MTVNFSLFTSAITTSNDVKVVLYKETDKTSEYVSQQQTGPLGDMQWDFPGLPRTNFICKILEVSIGGSTVLQQYGSFTFVPDNNEINFRAPEWIIVDTTNGLVAGTNTFTFDGSGSKPDWTGEDIIIERKGQGTMRLTWDYSWDSTTTIFNLLQSGDQFNTGEEFFVQFEPKVQVGGGVPTESNIFTSTKIITADTTLLAADAGKKIIIKGATPYIEVTLPVIATVTENRPFYFESAEGFHDCVKLISQDSNVLDYPKSGRTELYMKPAERITIYKSIDSITSAPTVLQNWRAHDAEGNFKIVGLEATGYMDVTDLLNVGECDGSIHDAESDARIYNEVVLNLGTGQVCDFTDWEDVAHPENKLKFSRKNVDNEFHFPDLRGYYPRNTSASLDPAQHLANQNKEHGHTIATTASSSSVAAGADPVRGSIPGDVNTRGGAGSGKSIGLSGGDEARPETYVTRRFIYT